ncbi:hypothetical protein SAMN05444008_11533 [Cnuella takakiae]|uniref:Uncharacterized protein n=1 Tax=Cnuella takakiae TaxID=1302690 RepID=A0A1M5FZD0_9BACT|nr:hypothetical protein [Cnuella takakiae]OLY92270.1 hypothetical protein BUE76_10490 [Cnuella takakiae]SHF96819.1 hypothetical protein SAMN05444008_11533 [Cnuella takakiae]
MITLQLWIDGKLHAERKRKEPPRPSTIAAVSQSLYTAYKYSIGYKPWEIVLVLQSKMNGNINQFASEIKTPNQLKSAA